MILIHQLQFLGLLCLQLSIHIHSFRLERHRFGRCRNPHDMPWQHRRRTSYSIAHTPHSEPPLYMYVIEDNHDQRPSRRFPRTTTNPSFINDDVGDTMYRKKLENYYYENNSPKQPSTSNKHDWKKDWGFEFHPNDDKMVLHNRTIGTTKQSVNFDVANDIRNYFPSTVDEVTDAVVATIATILQQHQPQQKSTKHQPSSKTTPSAAASNLDPNLLRNTVYSDNIMMSRRPVRHPQHDMGRIGIELDWSVPATTATDTRESLEQRPDPQDYSTVRYASLLLAGKLSTMLQEQQEGVAQNFRPIAIYYNTVQQALVASRQLLQLKRLELFQQEQQQQKPSSSSIYNAIHIRSLCQGDDIPEALIETSVRHNMTSTKLGRRLATGQIDSMCTSMILIVQPTNYNDEFRPPGPSINVIESIQRLVSIAAIEQIPVIMISPRFLKAQQQSLSTSSGYWDQSGYYQQSSLYAGIEPPPGPTPWILRDFTPPAFCYVANALSCKIPNDKCMKNDDVAFYRNMVVNDVNQYSYYSHLSLWQSVLHQGHGWNLFAAVRQAPGALEDFNPQSSKLNYRWIGTSKNSAGRPTRQFMRRIWREYITARKSY